VARGYPAARKKAGEEGKHAKSKPWEFHRENEDRGKQEKWRQSRMALGEKHEID